MEDASGWGWPRSSSMDTAGVQGHACAVRWSPSPTCLKPTASKLARLTRGAQDCLQPASWHHASKLLLRSRKALMLEKKRQMECRCRLIIHAYSPFKFIWDCINVTVFSVVCVYMPWQVFFPCPNQFDPLILFGDAISFLSIIISFLTGYVDKDGKRVVLEKKSIAKRYLKNTFIFDLIAAMPLQCIKLFDDCTLPTHTLFFLTKLLRMVSVERSWNNISNQIGIGYTASVAFAVLTRAFIFFHWMTFCHYQVPVLYAHLYGDKHDVKPWLLRVKAIGPTQPMIPAFVDKYISNVYYVSGICYGAAVYSTIAQWHLFLPEQLLIAAMGIIGLMFMTYAVTALLRLVVYHHFESYLYNGRLKELQEYLDFKGMPKCLKQKIQLYINYRFNGHYFSEYCILSTINVQIKQEINMFCCKKLVVNVPMFQNMPIALINTIIFSLTQVLYMPGEIVVKYGQPGSSIYLIASGTVAIMNAEGKEVGHLKDGAFFGERALLQPGTPRNATIVALEITEIYKLSHAQLMACLRPAHRPPRHTSRSY